MTEMTEQDLYAMGQEIKTTGQLRDMLFNAQKGLRNGDLDLDGAWKVYKLAKNICESLYSETKIAMFRHEVGEKIAEFGKPPLGDDSGEVK